jgi:hypothetical protein
MFHEELQDLLSAIRVEAARIVLACLKVNVNGEMKIKNKSKANKL